MIIWGPHSNIAENSSHLGYNIVPGQYFPTLQRITVPWPSVAARPWRWRQHSPSKFWELHARQQRTISQKTWWVDSQVVAVSVCASSLPFLWHRKQWIRHFLMQCIQATRLWVTTAVHIFRVAKRCEIIWHSELMPIILFQNSCTTDTCYKNLDQTQQASLTYPLSQ
jgi:hypothetical protein